MTKHAYNIELVETKNGSFNRITCPDDCYITSWNEGNDILEFNASKVICCPLKVEINATYRCITEAEYKVLEAQREEAEKVRMEEEMKNRNK